MRLYKIDFTPVIIFLVMAIMIIMIAYAEYANSPIVNGERMGKGYQCKLGVLYSVGRSSTVMVDRDGIPIACE